MCFHNGKRDQVILFLTCDERKQPNTCVECRLFLVFTWQACLHTTGHYHPHFNTTRHVLSTSITHHAMVLNVKLTEVTLLVSGLKTERWIDWIASANAVAGSWLSAHITLQWYWWWVWMNRIDERQIPNIIYNIIPWPSTVSLSQLTSSADAWSFFLDLLERRVNNPRKEAPAFTNSRLSFFSILYIEPDEDDILIQTRFLR